MGYRMGSLWALGLVAGLTGCLGEAGTYYPTLIEGTDEGATPPVTTDPSDPPGPQTPPPTTPPPDQPAPPIPVGVEFDCQMPMQDPGTETLRRLTVDEYNSTVSDVLAVDASDLVSMLPPDALSAGFRNATQTQTTAIEHVEAYAGVAAQIVGRVDVPNLISTHGSCNTFSSGCIDDFIDGFGERMFRRPLDAADRAPLTALFNEGEAAGATFDEVASVVVEAMLQAPRFLYRIENQAGPGTRQLDDYELAARLSYLVWGSSPDDALYAAAAAGQLSTGAELTAEVDRMMQSGRARAPARTYLHDWLRLSRLGSDSLSEAMRAETEALFEDLVWDQDAPLPNLFNADYTFASEELAQHYGLDNPTPGVQRYDNLVSKTRAGLLTHGSVLTSGGSGGSYVFRGLFFLRTFLCGEIDPPPPGVNDTPPTTEPGKSDRYYSEQRVGAGVCGDCHSQFEPSVYAFGKFDGDGAYREQDGHGNPLRSDGALKTPYDSVGRSYDGPVELGELMANDPRVLDCSVLKLTEYALGRALEPADACTLAAVREAVRHNGATYIEIIKAIVSQPAFRMTRAE